MWFGIHIVVHKCWLINSDVNMMQGTYNITVVIFWNTENLNTIK